LPGDAGESYPSGLHRAGRGICCWYQSVHVARASASCRYRIGHFTELATGVDVVIGARLPTCLMRGVRTVSCVRPLLSPGLAKCLARLRARGVVLVADYDDLLFGGDVSGLPASVAGHGDEHERFQRLSQYGAGLRAFDAFTVATRALRARLQGALPRARVTVVPNGVSPQWVAQGRALYRPFQAGDPRVIRYFAGSPSHDRDFASVVRPLRRFLLAHSDVRLEVVGPVRLDPTWFPSTSVASLPRVGYDALPGLLSSSWVNLAPLVTNDFNDCKSALKVLEAGAFGCPTLATINDDVARHVELGAPILVCHSDEGWYGALEAMLSSEARAEAGRGIAAHVDRHGHAAHSFDDWCKALGLGDAA
jgi:glycosyltransferase involved in cell wall biosynthesis